MELREEMFHIILYDSSLFFPHVVMGPLQFAVSTSHWQEVEDVADKKSVVTYYYYCSLQQGIAVVAILHYW